MWVYVWNVIFCSTVFFIPKSKCRDSIIKKKMFIPLCLLWFSTSQSNLIPLSLSLLAFYIAHMYLKKGVYLCFHMFRWITYKYVDTIREKVAVHNIVGWLVQNVQQNAIYFLIWTFFKCSTTLLQILKTISFSINFWMNLFLYRVWKNGLCFKLKITEFFAI